MEWTFTALFTILRINCWLHILIVSEKGYILADKGSKNKTKSQIVPVVEKVKVFELDRESQHIGDSSYHKNMKMKLAQCSFECENFLCK